MEIVVPGRRETGNKDPELGHRTANGKVHWQSRDPIEQHRNLWEEYQQRANETPVAPQRSSADSGEQIEREEPEPWWINY